MKELQSVAKKMTIKQPKNCTATGTNPRGREEKEGPPHSRRLPWGYTSLKKKSCQDPAYYSIVQSRTLLFTCWTLRNELIHNNVFPTLKKKKKKEFFVRHVFFSRQDKKKADTSDFSFYRQTWELSPLSILSLTHPNLYPSYNLITPSLIPTLSVP